MSGNRSDWFPTSVWYFDIDDSAHLNQALLAEIYAERTRDSQGVRWSNVLGWHSVDNLNHKPGFKNFTEIVRSHCTTVAKEMYWDLNRYQVSVSNCWANINNKFASNYLHNHPNSFLSGVYYIKTPENCGGLFFRDPRDVVHMFAPPVTELSPWTLQKITYSPTEGRMIIFPSWLMHGVEPNLSDDERISMSFNVSLISV